MELLFRYYFLFFALLLGKEPKTLENQKNKPEIESHSLFKEINKADIFYVYGPDGDKIISVKFDKSNNLLSKTSYNQSNDKQIYIYNDDCKKKECHQFIH